MRNYVPKQSNPDWLPHELYMQMLYIIRDYAHNNHKGGTNSRKKQWEAVGFACTLLQEEYKKRPTVYGVLNPLRAFFDYPYYSLMFAQVGSDLGAGKRSWNLYRCRFAFLIAEKLQLYSSLSF